MLRRTSHEISKWTGPTPPLTPATGPGRQKTDMTQKPSVEHLTTQTLQTQVEKDRRKLSKERLKNELVSSVVFYSWTQTLQTQVLTHTPVFVVCWVQR